MYRIYLYVIFMINELMDCERCICYIHLVTNLTKNVCFFFF